MIEDFRAVVTEKAESYSLAMRMGMRMVNIVPSPTVLWGSIVPPWFSTIAFVIDSPSPLPIEDNFLAFGARK